LLTLAGAAEGGAVGRDLERMNRVAAGGELAAQLEGRLDGAAGVAAARVGREVELLDQVRLTKVARHAFGRSARIGIIAKGGGEAPLAFEDVARGLEAELGQA